MKTLLRLFVVSPLPLLVALSCGGSAFNGAESGGAPNAGGSGGSGSNGTGGTGNGGKSGGTGGTGIGGGVGTTGGSVGAGGGPVDLCSLPAQTGSCEAYFERWYHDSTTGVCLPFVYGGCGGNENNFETRAQCENACDRRYPDLDACAVPTDCALAATGCCGGCEPVTASSFIAVNVANHSKFRELIGCGDVLCEPCLEPSELERQAQYFVPTCQSGQCTVIDLRTTPITACNDSTECALRDGASCCEGCDGGGIVAYNPNANLSSMVCGDMPPPCLACEPPIPEEYLVICLAGRCALQVVTPPPM